jgi:exodeoxyribonuclease V alpha subunit
LGADLILLDEASMVDPVLLAAVLDAMQPQAHLVLVGDPHQLTSVESGCLLPDLCRLTGASSGYDAATVQAFAPLGLPLPTVATAPELRGAVCRLQHNYRAAQHQPLVDLAQAILDGDVAGSSRAIDVPGTTCLQTGTPRQIVDLILAHASRVQACTDVTQAFSQLATVQVLCALRQGPWGAHGLAAAVDQALCPGVQRDGWYRGRAILITANDRTRGLMNGDVGLCWPVGNDLRVFFARPDRNLDFATADLPSHEPAWALTIHKSQGSEYAQVHAVLPPAADHPLVIRELLYTAVTRAKEGVTIWSKPDVFATAVQRASTRRSGLVEAYHAAVRGAAIPAVPGLPDGKTGEGRIATTSTDD